MKKLEADGRPATDDEKHILARYTGWGAMPAVFDYMTGRYDEWNEVRDTVKFLMTDEEHRTARGSIANAHYTLPLVINGIWSALERFGVKAGMRVLEPSMGVGNFYGLMPENLMPKSLRAGVELDSVTARIAKQLYQDATIFESRFEDAPFPDGFFDVAVGNVPFGSYGVHDPKYKAWQTSSIHDYFFVKTLDKLRPGGVLALITSRYTMDKVDDDVRAYLAEKADLIGAIRLPNKTFKDNAGTVVTTDLIFLQKREDGQETVSPSWDEVVDYTTPDTEDNPINRKGIAMTTKERITEITYQKLHLRTPQAADYLGLSASVMEKMRLRGDGPSYAKLGRMVIYAISDLDAWVNARKRTSTLDTVGLDTHDKV